MSLIINSYGFGHRPEWDDFDGVSLDAKWNQLGSEATFIPDGSGNLVITQPNQATDKINVITQLLPAGDFSATIRIINTSVFVDYNAFGIALTEDVVSNPSTSKIMTFFDAHFSSNNHSIFATTWANRFGSPGNFSSNINISSSITTVWLRLTRVGSTYHFYYSTDGSAYTEIDSGYSAAGMGLTPTRIGILVNNAGGASTDKSGTIDRFDFV